jgi:hypothetical protein
MHQSHKVIFRDGNSCGSEENRLPCFPEQGCLVLSQILQCLFICKDPQEFQFSASSNPKCPAQDKLKSPLIAKLPSVIMFWDQNYVTSSLAVLVAHATAMMSSRAVSRLWQSSLSSAISFDFTASIICEFHLLSLLPQFASIPTSFFPLCK